jgi:hypothetical protein
VNQFDVALGGAQGSLGFLKKIKKAVKSVGRSVEKAVKASIEPIRDIKSKVAQKTLPSSVRDLGRELDEKGIVKLAAATALTIVTGGAGVPLLAVAAGTIGAKALSDSAKRDQLDYQLDKAEKRAADAIAHDEAANVAAIGQAVRDLPEFQAVVDNLRAQGYTDAEIAQHWMQSRSYYMSAVETARAVVEPVVALEAVAAGVPDADLNSVVYDVSTRVAQQGVAQARAEVDATVNGGGAGWLAAIPVGLLALVALI